jgi:hypothetical protein
VVDLPQCRLQIAKERHKRPLGRGRARDQHIIRSRSPLARQNSGGYRPQSAFCSIAHYRIPDFAAGGEPNSHATRF